MHSEKETDFDPVSKSILIAIAILVFALTIKNLFYN